MTDLNGFYHGINLGGWLSQCNHTKQHYDTFICENDFKIIKDWGFDHVRIPVDYNPVQDKDGNFIESGFVYIQNAIDWAKKYGLNAILDLHKTQGFSFDDGENESGFFESEKYQSRFYELWEEFARRYSKYETMLCFELLNEVTSKKYCKVWNKIANNCIEKIRKISPSIRILIGSYMNNSVKTVKYLDPPHDSNIIFNFHCYEPLIFTHQGAPWIPKMDHNFRMPFNSKFSDYKKFTQQNINQEGDNFSRCNLNETPDENYFENLFSEAISFAEKYDTSLYCGEFGVIDRAAPEEALKWHKTINAVFEKHHIARALWSYKKMDFGLADEWCRSIRDEILKLK